MMQKFKFGDRVKQKSDGDVGVVVGTKFDTIAVVFDGGSSFNFYDAEEFEIIQNPDTVRLDYIERVINIDGMVKREMRKGWVLVDGDDIELSSPKPLLRDAIDSAMELTSGKKP
ncbi:MAG: hypothetical protein D8H97_04065 [Neisseria sp.]|nr:MAG: hypothetical protein D8H97_04065 [Neisseria sp.]